MYVGTKKMGTTRKPSTQKKHTRNVYAKTPKTKTRWWSHSANVPSQRNAFLKNIGVVLLSLSIIIGSVGSIGFGILWIYGRTTNSDFFATESVEVSGNVRLSAAMVRDFAGVHIGDNSLSISIADVEKSLLATPWVEEVSVKRLLPGRFSIKVQERMPSFWVRQEGILYYTDIKGKIIAPVESSNFMALPTLEIEDGAEHILKNLEDYLQDLKEETSSIEFGAISAVRINADDAIELYLDDSNIHLAIALDDWKDNLQRLSITLSDLSRRNELSHVREVRAVAGNVWVIRR